jgi:CIC family chloride channel protein
LLEAAGTEGRPLRELVKRLPVVVFMDESLRDAADEMVRHGIGRLPVVTRAAPRRAVGMLTRSDLLRAHGQRLRELHHTEPVLQLRRAGSAQAMGPPR